MIVQSICKHGMENASYTYDPYYVHISQKYIFQYINKTTFKTMKQTYIKNYLTELTNI